METKNKRSQIPDSIRDTRYTWAIKRENALHGMAWLAAMNGTTDLRLCGTVSRTTP